MKQNLQYSPDRQLFDIQGYYKRNRHFQPNVVSPDLTPCDFFLWGYIKDRVFVPPLPVSLNELKQRITTAAASVDEDMLRPVWTELDYPIDICHVKKTHTWKICNLKTCTTKPCKYFG